MATHAGHSLPSQLEVAFSATNKLLQNDEQFAAFSDTSEIQRSITFGWKSAGASDAVLCHLAGGRTRHAGGRAVILRKQPFYVWSVSWQLQ